MGSDANILAPVMEPGYSPTRHFYRLFLMIRACGDAGLFLRLYVVTGDLFDHH